MAEEGNSKNVSVFVMRLSATDFERNVLEFNGNF